MRRSLVPRGPRSCCSCADTEVRCRPHLMPVATSLCYGLRRRARADRGGACRDVPARRHGGVPISDRRVRSLDPGAGGRRAPGRPARRLGEPRRSHAHPGPSPPHGRQPDRRGPEQHEVRQRRGQRERDGRRDRHGDRRGPSRAERRGRKNCSTGSTFDDGNGHGTHVAGTIGARDNAVGVVGVAPGVRLYAVRVLDNSGAGTNSTVLCGIDFVDSKSPAKGGTITVANMSIGGPGPTTAPAGASTATWSTRRSVGRRRTASRSSRRPATPTGPSSGRSRRRTTRCSR